MIWPYIGVHVDAVYCMQYQVSVEEQQNDIKVAQTNRSKPVN